MGFEGLPDAHLNINLVPGPVSPGSVINEAADQFDGDIVSVVALAFAKAAALILNI